MFEGIEFEHNVIPNITNKIVDVGLQVLQESDEQNTLSDSEKTVYVNVKGWRSEMQGLEFYMSGENWTFHTPPLSPYAAKHLYWLEDFIIYRNPKGCFMRRQSYPHYVVFYTYEGCGELVYEGQTYTLKKGDGFFIDCRKPHEYRTAGETDWLYGAATLTGPDMAELYRMYAENRHVVFHQPLDGSIHTALEQVLNLYANPVAYRDWHISLTINRLLMDLLVDSAQHYLGSDAVPDEMQQLVQYLEHNFREPLTMDDLSKYTAISKSHLSREFKRYIGFSPVNYLIQLRIAEARRMLVMTDLPASKIALDVGFRDQNNFISQFKKVTGMTPGAYRSKNSAL